MRQRGRGEAHKLNFEEAMQGRNEAMQGRNKFTPAILGAGTTPKCVIV